MNEQEIFDFLNQKAEQYNHTDFIELDPISIPHLFSLKQDIEISAFFAATIAWGNRKSIITSAQKIINFMGNSPYDFVMSASEKDLEKLGYKAERVNQLGRTEMIVIDDNGNIHAVADGRGDDSVAVE